MIGHWRLVAPDPVEPVAFGLKIDPYHTGAVPVVPLKLARADACRGEVGERPIVAAVRVLDVVGAGQDAGPGGKIGSELLDQAGVQDLADPGADDIGRACGWAGVRRNAQQQRENKTRKTKPRKTTPLKKTPAHDRRLAVQPGRF